MQKLSRKDFLFFFLGADVAPSEAKTSDESSWVTACAQPRSLPEKESDVFSTNPADWYFDYVHAKRLTYKERASARQMSGTIHDLHRRFGYEKIVMDPQGGGMFVQRELLEARQLINGVEMRVTPIADQVNGPQRTGPRAHFILHMFRRSDPGFERLWTDLKYEDNFIDAMYSQVKDDMEHALLGWPEPINEILIDPVKRVEMLKWSEERRKSLQNLTTAQRQFTKISVEMTADGQRQFFTSHGARRFFSTGKKDLVSASMLCRLAFLIWLRSADFRIQVTPEDAPRFGGFEQP